MDSFQRRAMSEAEFWKLIFDQDHLKEFLIRHGMITNAATCNAQGLRRVNRMCPDPNRGSVDSFQKPKLTLKAHGCINGQPKKIKQQTFAREKTSDNMAFF